MKKFKAILINIILLLVLGSITIAFFYGWKYYKEKYDQDKQDYNEQQAEESAVDRSALLIGEKYEDKNHKKWGDIYFIDSKGEEKYLIDTAHDVSIMANPQATKTNLFYYEPGEKEESEDHLILWAADFKGASENKIAAFSKEFYPKGLWMSSDYSTVSYMRSFDSDEQSYWIFQNHNGVAREIVATAGNLDPVPYQGFNASGDKFNYFEKIDDEEYRLNQVKLKGTIISPAFRGVEWRDIDWEDLWEIRPIAISPTDDAMAYLDKDEKNDVIVKTDIKKVTDIGEFSTLSSLEGNIYELSWSPNGEYIAYNRIIYSDDGDKEKVVVEMIDSKGSSPKLLYESPSKDNLIYDIFWDKNSEELYFVDNDREVYSEIIKVNIDKKVSEVVYHKKADKKNDYIKILQTIDVPKDLDWKEVSKDDSSQKSSFNESDIFEYISDNINSLIQEPNQEDETWQVYKIGKADNSNYYAEYSKSDDVGKILLHCINGESELECDTTASYEPINHQWELVSGSDSMSEQEVVYFENQAGKWIESYSSLAKEVFPYNQNEVLQDQQQVDQGKEKWRLDPVKVVQNELPKKYKFDTVNDSFDMFISEDGESRVKVVHGDDNYEVKLYQLVQEGEGGIWTLAKINII